MNPKEVRPNKRRFTGLGSGGVKTVNGTQQSSSRSAPCPCLCPLGVAPLSTGLCKQHQQMRFWMQSMQTFLGISSEFRWDCKDKKCELCSGERQFIILDQMWEYSVCLPQVRVDLVANLDHEYPKTNCLQRNFETCGGEYQVLLPCQALRLSSKTVGSYEYKYVPGGGGDVTRGGGGGGDSSVLVTN